MTKISIVTPVYNEEESVLLFNEALKPILTGLAEDYEIIFCLDPSTDKTEQTIREMCSLDNRIKLLSFNRRAGQDIAVLAGIAHSSGDAIVIMDCDLQDPPSAIPEMFLKWSSGSKMVIGKRASREKDNKVKKLFSKLFYDFLNKFSEIPFPRSTGDFRLIDRSLVNFVNQFQEVKPFTKGVMSWIGADYEVVEFSRPERITGKTKYSELFGGYGIAFKTIISYSNILLKSILIFGMILTTVSLLTASVSGVVTLYKHELPGVLLLLSVLIIFLSGLIFVSIGILGLYIDRIFDEVKRRPRYTTKEFLNG